jgi:hypothetical protein
MENAALLILLESILGKGQKTSKGNYSFKCPFCSHHKNKMEINSITTAKKENTSIISVYDLTAQGWRSFIVKNVTNVTLKL